MRHENGAPESGVTVARFGLVASSAEVLRTRSFSVGCAADTGRYLRSSAQPGAAMRHDAHLRLHSSRHVQRTSAAASPARRSP